MRTLFHFAFAPVLITACVVSWLQRDVAERALVANGIRLDFASCVLLGVIACIWLAERLVPARKTPLSSELLKDLLYLFVVAQFSAVLIALVSRPLNWAMGPFGSARAWPVSAQFAVKVLLAFFTLEFFSYWLHRAAHRFSWLWQFHATHHGITELDGLKSLRTHPVENALFFIARTLPLLALGAASEEVVTATTFGAVLGLLAHSNLDLSTRGLGLVVNFPTYHAVHHSAVREESDSNFGCHTIVYDRLFRTFRPAAKVPLVIGRHPVGPRSLWEELVAPLYRRVR